MRKIGRQRRFLLDLPGERRRRCLPGYFCRPSDSSSLLPKPLSDRRHSESSLVVILMLALPYCSPVNLSPGTPRIVRPIASEKRHCRCYLQPSH